MCQGKHYICMLWPNQHSLVSAGHIVEDRVASLGGARLVEDVQILQGLELILLMHVVLGHDLLKLGGRHIHGRPPGGENTIESY